MIKAIIAVILICASGVAQTDKAQIYTEWKASVLTLVNEGDFETGLWPRLRDSLISDPPELVRSLDREQIIEELIKLHKERISHLERMLELERRH